MHPLHPQADRVLFHLSLSYFHRLPRTEDRDLSLAPKTLFYFNRHLKRFPHSPFQKQSREYKQKVLNLLARQQWMIVRFHLHQGKKRSALPYAQSLIKNYAFLLPKEENISRKKKAGNGKKKTEGLPSLQKLKKLLREIQNSA